MKIILAQYFDIFQIFNDEIWKISKYCAKMIFICSLVFLFLIKIRFPKGISISEMFFFILFQVRINPAGLEAGQVHFTSINAFIASEPERGPLFEVPVTVIIPITKLDHEYFYKRYYFSWK